VDVEVEEFAEGGVVDVLSEGGNVSEALGEARLQN